MKVTYNPGDDTLRILFRSAPIQESETPRPGLILDYDQDGRIVGLELAAASEHLSRPYPAGLIETAPDGQAAHGAEACPLKESKERVTPCLP